MPPFTLHFVYMLESSICTGRHYYALGTMERTSYGIQHIFASEGLLTNQVHSKTQVQLLCHTLDLVFDHLSGVDLDSFEKSHIPDISTFNGLLDVVSLIIIVDLQEIVNPIENPEPALRYQCLKVCHQANQLKLWLWKRCQLSMEGKRVDFLNDFFQIHLETQLDGLVGCMELCQPDNKQRQRKLTKDIETFYDYKPKFGKGFRWQGPRYDVTLLETPEPCKSSFLSCFSSLNHLISDDQALHSHWRPRDEKGSTFVGISAAFIMYLSTIIKLQAISIIYTVGTVQN